MDGHSNSNYSYQIAFKVSYQLFYSPLMGDGIAYDVLGLKWILYNVDAK